PKFGRLTWAAGSDAGRKGLGGGERKRHPGPLARRGKGVLRVLARLWSAALAGVEGQPVQVEVDLRPDLPAFDVVSLPGTAVLESRNRVRAAWPYSGVEMPLGQASIDLAAAALRDEGPLIAHPTAAGLLSEQRRRDAPGAGDHQPGARRPPQRGPPLRPPHGRRHPGGHGRRLARAGPGPRLPG